MVGMGCSSRPNDLDVGETSATSPEKINEYFTEYLERWRISMTHILTRLNSPQFFYSARANGSLNSSFISQGSQPRSSHNMNNSFEMSSLTFFVLAGHGMGGYIAGNYAMKYQKHVRKLLLLSPMGIRPSEPDSDTENASQLDDILYLKNPKSAKNQVSRTEFSKYLTNFT